jgi:hypothetical protein
MTDHPAAGRSVPDRPRVREDLVFRELGEEWVVFDPRSRRLHLLNLTAALVWSHCNGEHAVDEIVSRVEGAFADAPPPDDVQRDVQEALRTFASEDLLE